MTVAARIVALGDQVIPCAGVVHLIAFLHLFYTSTRRIVEFPGIGIDDIVTYFSILLAIRNRV